MNYATAETILSFSFIVAPLAMMITEFVKQFFPNVPKNYLPFISILAGILAGLVYPADFAWHVRILGGALAGLSGIGAFEAFLKQIYNAIKARKA